MNAVPRRSQGPRGGESAECGYRRMNAREPNVLLFLETYDCRVGEIREAARGPEEGGVRVMGDESEG